MPSANVVMATMKEHRYLGHSHRVIVFENQISKRAVSKRSSSPLIMQRKHPSEAEDWQVNLRSSVIVASFPPNVTRFQGVFRLLTGDIFDLQLTASEKLSESCLGFMGASIDLLFKLMFMICLSL